MASYGLTYDQFQELFDAVEAESEDTYWESGFRIATGRWGHDRGPGRVHRLSLGREPLQHGSVLRHRVGRGRGRGGLAPCSTTS